MEDDTDQSPQEKEQDKGHVLSVLGSLKRASKDLQYFPTSFIARSPEPAVRDVLELGREIRPALESDPGLFGLAEQLSGLESLLGELDKSRGYGLKQLIRRQTRYYRIAKIAWEIEAQAQGYLDKEVVVNLMRALSRPDEVGEEEPRLRALVEFQDRVDQGFHMGLQDLILRSKVFSVLESRLCDSGCPKALREQSGSAIVGLVRFNRNVFVGLVMMGPTIGALVAIGSCRSIRALSCLVRLVRSPLIDEMYAHGEVPRIVKLLDDDDDGTGDPGTRVSCLECVCEIAYFGRKEVVEGILREGMVERLMELQRSVEEPRESPFTSCVSRFAVQVEVGEGLTQQEKRELKMEILRRVKEASASEAEAASIAAEVLWGSSPLSF